MNTTLLFAVLTLVTAFQRVDRDDQERRQQLEDERTRLEGIHPELKDTELKVALDNVLGNAFAAPVESATFGSDPEFAVNPLNLSEGERELRARQRERQFGGILTPRAVESQDVDPNAPPAPPSDTPPDFLAPDPQPQQRATVRAKFKVTSVEDGSNGAKNIKLAPVYSDDPNSENGKFFSATPWGEVYLGGAQAEAGARFTKDQEFYIDFIPVETPAPAEQPPAEQPPAEQQQGEQQQGEQKSGDSQPPAE